MQPERGPTRCSKALANISNNNGRSWRGGDGEQAIKSSEGCLCGRIKNEWLPLV